MVVPGKVEETFWVAPWIVALVAAAAVVVVETVEPSLDGHMGMHLVGYLELELEHFAH